MPFRLILPTLAFVLILLNARIRAEDAHIQIFESTDANSGYLPKLSDNDYAPPSQFITDVLPTVTPTVTPMPTTSPAPSTKPKCTYNDDDGDEDDEDQTEDQDSDD